MGYKPFYIKKQKDGASTFDSVKKWNLYCVEFPFKLFGDIKQLPSNQFPDEDGADEYIPDVLPVEAYEVEATFGCKGKKEEVHGHIKDFILYLKGMDKENAGKSSYGCEVQIYDTYTGIGRQGCRLVKIGDTGYFQEIVRDDSGVADHVLLTFKLTFKVNDPTTDIKLTDKV